MARRYANVFVTFEHWLTYALLSYVITESQCHFRIHKHVCVIRRLTLPCIFQIPACPILIQRSRYSGTLWAERSGVWIPVRHDHSTSLLTPCSAAFIHPAPSNPILSRSILILLSTPVFLQPPGRDPVSGPGIKYSGPRQVLLEFVIFVF